MRIEVDFGPEWRKSALALRHAENSLPRKLDRTLGKNSQEAVRRARAAVLGMPTHGKKHRGTRARVAKGTRSRKMAGRLGRSITTSMPPGEEAIPRGFTASFRHPVFGGPAWVNQVHNYDWFMGPIASVREEAADALHDDLEATARLIAKSS